MQNEEEAISESEGSILPEFIYLKGCKTNEKKTVFSNGRFCRFVPCPFDAVHLRFGGGLGRLADPFPFGG